MSAKKKPWGIIPWGFFCLHRYGEDHHPGVRMCDKWCEKEENQDVKKKYHEHLQPLNRASLLCSFIIIVERKKINPKRKNISL